MFELAQKVLETKLNQASSHHYNSNESSDDHLNNFQNK
jgi:hypothetical protein